MASTPEPDRLWSGDKPRRRPLRESWRRESSDQVYPVRPQSERWCRRRRNWPCSRFAPTKMSGSSLKRLRHLRPQEWWKPRSTKRRASESCVSSGMPASPHAVPGGARRGCGRIAANPVRSSWWLNGGWRARDGLNRELYRCFWSLIFPCFQYPFVDMDSVYLNSTYGCNGIHVKSPREDSQLHQTGSRPHGPIYD